MPRSHKSWSCIRCGGRFRSYAEAEKCELSHLVDDVSASFKRELDGIVNAEPTMKSPKERMR